MHDDDLHDSYVVEAIVCSHDLPSATESLYGVGVDFGCQSGEEGMVSKMAIGSAASAEGCDYRLDFLGHEMGDASDASKEGDYVRLRVDVCEVETESVNVITISFYHHRCKEVCASASDLLVEAERTT